MNFIGLLGNILLSLCGVPLLISSLLGQSYTSPYFLLAWGAGEVCALLYGLHKGIPKIITINYGVSILLILGITYAQYGRQ